MKRLKALKEKRKVAVVAAQDEHTLQAVFRARENDIVEPVLIGNAAEIKKILKKLNKSLNEENIIDVEGDAAAAQKGVELALKGQVDFIMKGIIQTADLLRAVVR